MTIREHSRKLAHSAVWAYRHVRGKLYEPDTYFATLLLNPEDVALDVGSHSGSWTVALAKLFPECHVYSVEALPYYADVLKQTLSVLRLRNVTVLNYAANETGEDVAVAWRGIDGKRLAGLTHIAEKSDNREGTVHVSGIRLDSLLPSVEPRRIRFIKMDIEGAELPALRGASEILRTHKPALYLEAWASYAHRYGYELRELFAFLEHLGYSPFLARHGALPTPILEKDYPGSGDLWFLTAEDARSLAL